MDHIGRLRPVLKPLGIDGDEFIRVLNVKIDVATRVNARQEAQKAELKRTTTETEEAFTDVYRTASGFLDAIVGALGKKELPGGPGPPAPPQPDPAARGRDGGGARGPRPGGARVG